MNALDESVNRLSTAMQKCLVFIWTNDCSGPGRLKLTISPACQWPPWFCLHQRSPCPPTQDSRLHALQGEGYSHIPVQPWETGNAACIEPSLDKRCPSGAPSGWNPRTSTGETTWWRYCAVTGRNLLHLHSRPRFGFTCRCRIQVTCFLVKMLSGCLVLQRHQRLWLSS